MLNAVDENRGSRTGVLIWHWELKVLIDRKMEKMRRRFTEEMAFLWKLSSILIIIPSSACK